MEFERRLLIIGNAVLFSAFGCDDGTDDPAETGTVSDARPRDASGGAIDRGEALDAAADFGAPVDGGVDLAVPADAALDLGAGDAAADLGASEHDMQLPDEGMTTDAALDPDRGALLDRGPPDRGTPDRGPPDPDRGPFDPDMQLLPPDMQLPPARCADLLGAPCEVRDEGCCNDAERPDAVCWPNDTGALSWQTLPPDFFCFCSPGPEGRPMVACAVPGFVGIERAGRTYPHAPCLRTLARRWG